MAASTLTTRQYASENFVESCGAILFDLSQSPLRVCLIHSPAKNEWLLAKGRRNCGESRQDAALREAREETGYFCRLLPVRMSTRAPPMNEAADLPDKARTYDALTEPFMVAIREIDGASNIKVIWWYLAMLDRKDSGTSKGQKEFRAELFTCKEASEKLSFQTDREVLQEAFHLVETQSEQNSR